ncbi:MAG: hypothetical protein IT381_06450 [Deltaproteobacteria bacterium]|nr:hypothetical protein [Deltaproteobacteria bacterium]
MEKKYIAFDSGRGCAVGCLAYVLMAALCFAGWWFKAMLVGFAAAFGVGAAIFAAAFFVDRRWRTRQQGRR